MFKLVLKSGDPQPGREVPILDRVSIGRAPDNHFRLEDRSVSSVHAEVVL